MNSFDQPKLDETGAEGDHPTDTTDRTGDPTTGLDYPLPPSEDLTGKTLDEYLLLALIGSGGGGRVYKAQHRHMERVVALKVFSQGLLRDPLQVKRLYREVRAAARLIHPNIVMAFDAGQYRSMHYLVMEFVEGHSLARLVQANGPLSLCEATQYLIQAARGLAYAHVEGIVHRDVKPDNIMVDRAGTVKLLDMGLARLQGIALQDSQGSESTSITSQGVVLGTVGYISPEQITDPANVDQRCDLYSLACTYFFLLTGRAPYKGSILEVLRAHADAPVPSLKDFRSDVPYGLDALFQRMMAKAPAHRVATATELIELLEPFAASSGELTDQATDQTRQKRGPPDPSARPGAGTRRAVGFDLSSKYAYLSSVNEDGEPTPLKDREAGFATPAALLYKNGAFHVGGAALRESKGRSKGLIERLTCRLGTGKPPYQLAGQKIPTEALAAVLIANIAKAAAKPGDNFEELCYTVPDCHGEARRRAYRDAYFIALGRECAAVNAASAVAIEFSFLNGWLNPQRSSPPKTLLVFRCGESSFDATVYRVEDRRLSAAAIAGEADFGEFSWDKRILDRLLEGVEPRLQESVLSSREHLFQLRRQVDAAKAALARGDKSATLRVRLQGKPLEQTLSYSALSQMGEDLLGRLEAYTAGALSEAGVGWDSLDHVLLAGSGARLPFIHEAVKRWSGNREIFALAGPEVAAGGAALVAESLVGTRHAMLDFQLQDASSHAYGIRMTDSNTGAVETQIVIPPNSPLPAASRGTVVKHQPRQSEIRFEAVELVGSDLQTATVLGECTVSNLPPGLPVGAPVDVEFSIDARGILSLSAFSLATSRRYWPTYSAAIGLDSEERGRWRSWLESLG